MAVRLASKEALITTSVGGLAPRRHGSSSPKVGSMSPDRLHGRQPLRALCSALRHGQRRAHRPPTATAHQLTKADTSDMSKGGLSW